MPEKGRRDSIIGTNRYGPEFLDIKKNSEIKVSRRFKGHAGPKYIVWESSLVTEHRAVTRFLIFKELPARDITAELEGMHGHEAFSLSAVKKWRKRFVNGIITPEDDPRSRRAPRAIFVNFYGP
jgi:hypothetical protein